MCVGIGRNLCTEPLLIASNDRYKASFRCNTPLGLAVKRSTDVPIPFPERMSRGMGRILGSWSQHVRARIGADVWF